MNTSNGESDWLLRAAALEHESDWQGLLQLSQQWVKSKPNDAGAWVDLGLAYSQLGQYSKALEANQEAVRLDPKMAYAGGTWG